jgi:Secretion system C-terminal sorting domain
MRALGFIIGLLFINISHGQLDIVKSWVYDDARVSDFVTNSDGTRLLSGWTNYNDLWDRYNRVNAHCDETWGKPAMWIAKVDSNWKIIWERCYASNKTTWGERIFHDGRGGYVIISTTEADTGVVQGNHGQQDIWLLHIDSVGNVLDSRMYGGPGFDEMQDVVQTKDGGYLIGATSNAAGGDVPGHYGSGFSVDAWAIKLDSNFNIVINWWWGGSGADGVGSIVEYPDGSIAIAASSNSDDHDVTSNYYWVDTWLIKLDKDGKRMWQKNLGGYGEYDLPYDMLITPDSGLMIVGERSGQCPFDSLLNTYSGSIIKVDKNGTKAWERCYGGSSEDAFESIIYVPEQGIYLLGGFTDSDDHDVKNYYGSIDIWLVAINDKGDLLWEKTFGGSGYDKFSRVIKDIDNHYIMIGFSTSNNYDLTGLPQGNKGWMFEVGLYPLGIEQPGNEIKIEVRPNPFQGQVTLRFEQQLTTPLVFRAYDLLGRPVAERTLPAGIQQQSIDTSAWPVGMFIYEILTEKGVRVGSGKVVKTVSGF